MKIEKIFVVGSGLMGGGITQVSAQAGYKVTMHDVKREFCDKGLEAIKFSLGKFLQKEKISQDHHDAALSNISTTTSLEDAKDADLVVEAVFEKLEAEGMPVGEGININKRSQLSRLVKGLGYLPRKAVFLAFLLNITGREVNPETDFSVKLRSPLLNVERACLTCHPFPAEEMKARVQVIQDRNAALLSRANPPSQPPVFALHAKSMVVDGRVAFIGTFNFDPRSENLNTEVGAVIHHPGLARRLQAVMEADMRPENSWSAADKPDQYVPLTKRGHVRLWQLLPLKPLL